MRKKAKNIVVLLRSIKKNKRIFIFFFLMPALLLIFSSCASSKVEKKTQAHDENAGQVIEENSTTERISQSETEAVKEIDENRILEEENSKEQDITTKQQTSEWPITNKNLILYAQTSVNVRSEPHKDGQKIGMLQQNEEVQVTGQCGETGWYQIKYQDVLGYVSNQYLADIKADVPISQVMETSVAESGYETMENATIEQHGTIAKTDYSDTGNEQLNKFCDKILDEIVNADMTDREKAYAVYVWITENIRYRTTPDMDDWKAAACSTFETYRGDCYGFYSVSRALLTRLGFENTEAKSYGDGHFWNMVKVDGFWWHFDTTPGWGTERFLWTSSQINNYSYYSEKYQSAITYDWNSEGCPQTP